MPRGWTPVLAAMMLLTITPAALAQQQQGETVTYLEMFFFTGEWIGTGIILLLLLMSAFSLGFSLMLLMQYRRSTLLPTATRDEIEALIADKKYREAIDLAQTDPSYLGKLTNSALGEASNGFGAMERAIEETGDVETTRILRPVEYLNVVGNIAPMIGLFGTVYGMIVAFQTLVAAGGNAEPAELAAGISTALVTTFWGLVVAIPALAAYALIRNRIDALTSEGLVQAEQIITPFKPGAKRAGGGASGGGSPSGGGASGGSGGGGGSRPRATPKPGPAAESSSEKG